MNALRSPKPFEQPATRPRLRPRRQHRPEYRLTAVEATVKLGANAVLSAAAIAALVKLVPYHFSQQAKLQEVHAEVQRAQKRVDRLQADFNRYFDPQQAKSAIQEESRWTDPQQHQVLWVEPISAEEELGAKN